MGGDCPDSCPVCCEPFNRSTRRSVQCPHCEQRACRKCVTTYLMQSADKLDHCLHCAKPWTRRFFASQMTRVFMQREYKFRREAVVFDAQKAQLEATIPFVQCKKRQETLQANLRALWQQYDLIQRSIQQTQSEMERERRFFLTGAGDPEQAARQQPQSRGHCPRDGCNGLIAETWRCISCETPVCNRCLCERQPDHLCEREQLDSVRLIRQDTRPCPGCAVRIYLIEGCAQMWCTHCNQAWNWRTGRLISTTNYHNPHFAEFMIAQGLSGQQQGARHPERGCLTYSDLHAAAHRQFAGCADLKARWRALREQLQGANQALDFHTDPRTAEFERKLRELRVSFLLNEISEQDFRTAVQRVDKAASKRAECAAVYSMFGESARDTLGRFAAGELSFENCMQGLAHLAKYKEDSLQDIHTYYGTRAKFS